MKQLKLQHSPICPVDAWAVTEDKFSPQRNMYNETIFTLGNGYIGMRGSFEEGLAGADCRTVDGIYLNGFFESVPIPHAERGYGYALNTQTMLNVTNSKMIELFLEDERFSMLSGTILDYKRTLDFKKGCLTRSVHWRSPAGKEVKITITRLVSLEYRHLMAFNYQVEAINFSGDILLCSSLDGAVDNHTHAEEDPRFSAKLGGLGLSVESIAGEETRAVMQQCTKRSKLKLACAMEHSQQGGTPAEVDRIETSESVAVRHRLTLNKGESACLVKFVSYYTSRDYPEDELAGLALKTVKKGMETGFQALLETQQQHLDDYWKKIGVNIEGDSSADQAMHLNLFHLRQAAGCDGKTGIGAKGLSSEGYDGHYFWDTEIYMLPFFAAVLPDEARKLLEYRYSILDQARERAKVLNHPRGALYPWRTIAGEEGSSYYPAGTAQYHINVAIAYAISKYIEMTNDYSFMIDYGAEIIFETARLWRDLGTFVGRRGNRFCYNEVTGPDEYTALVSNNCYTNLMAQWHLHYACDIADRLKDEYPEVYKELAKKIDLQEEELEEWRRAAENMYIPYDETLQIHPQDDSFLDKEIWDFASTPDDKYPLLLHFHPLVIYRHQVCKQPDVILAHFLLPDRYSREQKRHDYNYYEPITTHDSSLSPSIFSIVASDLGNYEDAEEFFEISSRLDLDNLLKDTHFGLHMANMAGSWLDLAYGFGGMRTVNGELSFKPYLPRRWNSYSFNILFHGSQLQVAVKEKRVYYRLLLGEKITFKHIDQVVFMRAGEESTFLLRFE